MSEIKTEIKKVSCVNPVCKIDGYLITEDHTIGDIIRFAISESDIESVQYSIDIERELSDKR